MSTTNPPQLELLSGFLRHHGFEVVEAADGFDAVACTSGGRLDLALLDQRMPRLGGIDAMQRLREIQPDLIIKERALAAMEQAGTTYQRRCPLCKP